MDDFRLFIEPENWIYEGHCKEVVYNLIYRDTSFNYTGKFNSYQEYIAGNASKGFNDRVNTCTCR